jgi:hypothetical protein
MILILEDLEAVVYLKIYGTGGQAVPGATKKIKVLKRTYSIDLRISSQGVPF